MGERGLVAPGGGGAAAGDAGGLLRRCALQQGACGPGEGAEPREEGRAHAEFLPPTEKQGGLWR